LNFTFTVITGNYGNVSRNVTPTLNLRGLSVDFRVSGRSVSRATVLLYAVQPDVDSTYITLNYFVVTKYTINLTTPTVACMLIEPTPKCLR
jgi:hypothetical protein